MVANYSAEENHQFLDSLGLKTDEWPNYEPAYLDTLAAYYDLEYKRAIDKVYPEGFDEFHPFDHIEEAFDGEFYDEFIESIFGLASSGTKH